MYPTSRCKPCQDKKNRENAKKNPASLVRAGLKWRRGLTWPEFTKLYEDQHGACGMCKRPLRMELGMRKGKTEINIDHCHATGKVRGILCRKCNTGLGVIGDTIESLHRAIAYLNNPPYRGETKK